MLPLPQQLYLAGVAAPLAARRLGRRSGGWLVAYVASAAAVLALVAWQLVAHEDRLLQLALDYVVPRDWQFAARTLVRRLFAQQEQLVLTNAVVAAALLVVQLALFPLKEMASAALEREAALVAEPVSEHPLWFQAWEEIKLFLAMIAAQGAVFWIGYSDDPTRRGLAVATSFLVVATSVAADFLSPVLQRHQLRYSQILSSLAAHPVLSLGFGALFALPALAATSLAAAHADWGFGAQVVVAFGGQVVGVALAVIGGTVAGAPLLADARSRAPARAVWRAAAWLALIGLLAWNGARFAAVGRSLHHKSQLLKCEYAVDWSSLDVATPSALELVAAARADVLTLGVSFAVTVRNPTVVDVEIEDNRLEARQDGRLVATAALPRGKVPAGATVTLRAHMPLTVAPSQALRIRDLLTARGWTLTLFLEVADGFAFPIYLITR